MNHIKTKTCLNEFSGSSYYIIEVDRESLEDIVLKNRPEITKGLVPTLLNWLSDPEEQKEVWSRVTPKLNESFKLPILICSDDVDLWCTLIITEVTSDNEFIYWNSFGLEDSDATTPKEIGKSVMWFEEVDRMKFKKEEYLGALENFRKNLNCNDSNCYQSIE